MEKKRKKKEIMNIKIFFSLFIYLFYSKLNAPCLQALIHAPHPTHLSASNSNFSFLSNDPTEHASTQPSQAPSQDQKYNRCPYQ